MRLAIAFTVGLALGIINDAHAVGTFSFSTDSFVKKIEAMLQVQPGTIKIVPQIASTFEYMGAKVLMPLVSELLCLASSILFRIAAGAS